MMHRMMLRDENFLASNNNDIFSRHLTRCIYEQFIVLHNNNSGTCNKHNIYRNLWSFKMPALSSYHIYLKSEIYSKIFMFV